MKWSEAYIQMKDNKAFVRRQTWGHKYFIWLKHSINIREEWCKDPLLLEVIKTFGMIDANTNTRLIKAEDAICLFNGYSVETGMSLRPEDRVADDWEIVKLKPYKYE